MVSCAVLVFGYGVAVGQFRLFPHSILEAGWTALHQVAEEREMLTGTRPTEFLEPARYEGSGVTRNVPGRATDRLTLLSGFFEGGNQLRLIRLDGTVVQKWPVGYHELFKSSDHVQPPSEVPKTDWNAAVHGSLALPDGSIVFNFTYKGLVKLDRCGVPQWTLPQMTHHGVGLSADGSMWVPSARYVSERSPYPNLYPPYLEDTIIKVDQAGKVLTEISVVDLLFKNNLQGLLHWKRGTGDITHVNDVEELPAELAAKFPMFAAGDLMISARMPHLVLVFDPSTLKVKWFQAGPWIGQHDPDFMDNGRILVFNNNDDGKGGTRYGGSNILEIDPATHAVSVRYGRTPAERMFTHERGKHQPLPLGHVLVTEANAGRAFEIDDQGQIVWEFVNRYDERDAALITEATRYPASYFTVTDWSCR